MIALSIFITLFFIFLISFPKSPGKAYPTVSGIFIVLAPDFIAISIALYKKLRLVLDASSGDHSTSSVYLLDLETLLFIDSRTCGNKRVNSNSFTLS